MNKLISLLAGIIFGTGLVVSEMINPEKVLSFLDVFGNWDPSLAFVMIGALIVSSPMFHLIKNNKKPSPGLIDGRNSLAIAEALTESAKKSKSIKVNLNDY